MVPGSSSVAKLPKPDKPEKESEESKIIEFVYPIKTINKNAGLSEAYQFFCDQYGTPSTCISGVVVSIDSEEFHNKIASDYFLLFNKIFGQQSWEKAKRYFKILAGNEEPVVCPLRVHASSNGNLYYDTGTFIAEFDGLDMKLYTPEASPVKFRRYKHSLLAPIRRPNSSTEPDAEKKTDSEVLNELMKYFNTKNFVPAILPTYFIDKHSQPIMCFTGAAGSAKSTFQTMIKRLVDPTSAERLNMCDDKNDWVTMWDKFYVLDFDNVRDIKAEEADLLSRGVTGGSIIRRTLYTTSDVSIFSGKLRIMMNGIRPEPTQFNDLLDRMIIVEMERINPDKRLSDEKLWEKLTDAFPEARFVCLDLAARAYRTMWTAKHERLPRLGEFARLADAVNVELHAGEDTDAGAPGAFIKWYFGKIAETSSVGVEDDFANIMLRFLNDGGQEWFTKEEHSTHEWVSQVLDYCTQWDSSESRYYRFDLKRATEEKGFPKNAVAFGRRITEIVPVLNEHSFGIRKRHTSQGISYTIYRQ